MRVIVSNFIEADFKNTKKKNEMFCYDNNHMSIMGQKLYRCCCYDMMKNDIIFKICSTV